MQKIKVLQEIRIMRFEELYGQWTEDKLTQEEAARILGVSERVPSQINIEAQLIISQTFSGHN